MAITQMTRFKSDKTEEMVKNAKNAKTIFEKHGAEFLRISRFHTGIWAGEWLVVTRYASWEAYGKAQEGLVLLRHNFSSPVSRSTGSATRTSRQGSYDRVDQARAHGCDRIRNVAFRPQGRIPWVDNRRIGQASGRS